MKLKAQKIASNIEKKVSEIVLLNTQNELFKTITITGAELSDDLSVAKIYYTSSSQLEKKKIDERLNKSASFVRKELARTLDLRHTPSIKFIYDESIAYAKKIESIIDKISNEDN